MPQLSLVLLFVVLSDIYEEWRFENEEDGARYQ